MPEINLGKVVGPQGPQGATGPAGAQGKQGIQGAPGKDATINGYNALNLTAGGAAQLMQNGGNAVITASGRNLLDNAYWASIDDIIDQRKGYVLVPGANYYSDSTLAADKKVNTEPVSAYATVYSVVDGGTYKSFKISASATETFYATSGDVVSGYVSNNNVDRWRTNGELACLLYDDYIRIERSASSSSHKIFFQYLDKKMSGPAVLSFLYRINTGSAGTIYLRAQQSTGDVTIAQLLLTNKVIDDWTLSSLKIPDASKLNSVRIQFNPQTQVGSFIEVKAIKLELGSTQTLAYQDENGNWVLNDPPPDRTLELMKYQRYFQLFSSADRIPADKRDSRPELRTNATESNTGTIEIGGVTYHYVDANL